jgi:DnaJ domain
MLISCALMSACVARARAPELSLQVPLYCTLSFSTPIPEMSSGLYELLGIARDASPEQGMFYLLFIVKHRLSAHWPATVRKAYKKKALETHPDRLPPGATPDQKLASEDKFRKVCFIYAMLLLYLASRKG